MSTPTHDPFRGVIAAGPADGTFPEDRLRAAGASDADIARLRAEHDTADDAARVELGRRARQSDLDSLRGWLADGRRDGYEPADRTVAEVLDDVDADPSLAAAALDAERAGSHRKTLVERLERIVAEQGEQTTIDVQPDDTTVTPDSA